jgi:hypothetical protein
VAVATPRQGAVAGGLSLTAPTSSGWALTLHVAPEAPEQARIHSDCALHDDRQFQSSQLQSQQEQHVQCAASGSTAPHGEDRSARAKRTMIVL